MQDLATAYPVWLCDVWGVVHDGAKPIASAVDALQRHRREGGKVIFITNAPRPNSTIQRQLDGIGVPRDASDAMVTSGDVTRHLMMQHGKGGLFHLGPEQDLPLFVGLDLQRVPLAEAVAVVCTGFLDETRETARDYLPQLLAMKAKGLGMICANPDKVVRKGDILVPCAGAIAEEYEAMGGTVWMAGKPYAPIYDVAMALADCSDKGQVLAIGDGPETDIKGALAYGVACVFISGGINSSPDAAAEVRRKYPEADIVRAMPELYWG